MCEDETENAVAQQWESLSQYDFPEAIVQLLAECTQQGRAWSSSANDAAKTQLKGELFVNQKFECAYCRRKIKDEPGHVEIDHILPKGQFGDTTKRQSNLATDRHCTHGYPQFSYHPRNLILTCKRCNNKKGTYDSRSNRSDPSTADYDMNANFYEWVHPHIDDYSDCIQLLKGLIYQPVNGSPKGNSVIVVCKLDEVSAVERTSREAIAKSASSYTSAIMALLKDVDAIGWEELTDTVAQAFHNIERSIIEESIQQIRSIFGE
jgi:5-methylcytosine-specific restriction endonuclease McrA